MTGAAAKKTPPNRPTLVKQPTRAGKERQDDALDAGFSITLDGNTYTVQMGDLTALDARELRRQTGYSFPQLMMLAMGDGADIDIIAGAIWFARYVSGEKSLTYEDVAGETTYDVVNRIEMGDPEPEDVGPEA